MHSLARERSSWQGASDKVDCRMAVNKHGATPRQDPRADVGRLFWEGEQVFCRKKFVSHQGGLSIHGVVSGRILIVENLRKRAGIITEWCFMRKIHERFIYLCCAIVAMIFCLFGDS